VTLHSVPCVVSTVSNSGSHLRCSKMLRSVDWYLVTDVSRQTVGPIFKGEAWKPIGDRLQRPHYLSRVDHERKIRSRRQKTDIGKYSFVSRTIQHWNQLPAEVLGILPCKTITFKKRVGKVIIELN